MDNTDKAAQHLANVLSDGMYWNPDTVYSLREAAAQVLRPAVERLEAVPMGAPCHPLAQGVLAYLLGESEGDASDG